MKFKYYLRGAGIGMITATIILAIAFLFHKGTMSDAEVIERALELGMVMDENPQGSTLSDTMDGKQDGQAGAENTVADTGISDADTALADTGVSDADTVLADTGVSDTDTSVDTGVSDTDTSADTDVSDTSADTAVTDVDVDDTDTSAAPEPDTDTDQQKPQEEKEKDTVTIVIKAGDVSRIISHRVARAGLVESAEEFNDYLGANDYDNRLRPGTYEIKKGATFEEIAKILTGG